MVAQEITVSRELAKVGPSLGQMFVQAFLGGPSSPPNVLRVTKRQCSGCGGKRFAEPGNNCHTTWRLSKDLRT
jgi:hypothetical protein